MSYGITCVQFVRCVVLTVQKVEGNKRIELSLKASLVNSGLVARHLHLCSLIVGEVRGFWLRRCHAQERKNYLPKMALILPNLLPVSPMWIRQQVTSEEDHGYSVNVGLPDVRGAFLPFSSVAEAEASAQPLKVAISSRRMPSALRPSTRCIRIDLVCSPVGQVGQTRVFSLSKKGENLASALSLEFDVKAGSKRIVKKSDELALNLLQVTLMMRKMAACSHALSHAARLSGCAQRVHGVF